MQLDIYNEKTSAWSHSLCIDRLSLSISRCYTELQPKISWSNCGLWHTASIIYVMNGPEMQITLKPLTYASMNAMGGSEGNNIRIDPTHS